jgi:hypothetical protein
MFNAGQEMVSSHLIRAPVGHPLLPARTGRVPGLSLPDTFIIDPFPSKVNDL